MDPDQYEGSCVDRLEAMIHAAYALADDWDNRGDRFGMGYYPECARELRAALENAQVTR